MPISAVTFDVGGTLIEPWPSVGHVYAEVASRHGVKNISAALLNERFESTWKARNGGEDTKAGWEEFVDDVFAGLASEPPSTTFFSELYERFAQPGAWRIFDDVLPILGEFTSRGIRIGVISNWDERLRVLLARLRLDRCFDPLIISCEAGYAKPSAGIFALAATNLRLPANSILHVGDSLEMDVLGARAAGFHAVRICRDTKPQKGPDDIQSFAELPAKLAKLADAPD